MIAVTSLAKNSIETSLIATVSPKNAESPRVWMAVSVGAAPAATAGSCSVTSVNGSPKACAGHRAGDEADDQHHPDEDERARPRQRVPLGVGTDRVAEDLQWKRRDWLADLGRPELIAECGEEKRSGLAGDPCNRDERPCDDPRECRAEHDRERRPPTRISERKSCLTKRDGDHAQHLFGSSRHHRYHHRPQRDSAGESREMTDRSHQKLPGENTEHDRGQPV